MNFLAHAHLSGENPDLLVGNLIADSVKGNQVALFPKQVANGILLHRQIDTYTDAHETVRKSVGTIRKEAGKYSGVVVDIYYDHFLARKWSEFSNIPLSQFTVSAYRILGNHHYLLPGRVKRMLPYMIAQNWLNSYANLKDLRRIFWGMDRRTKFISGMSRAVDILESHYDSLEKDFEDFYPEMIAFASEFRNKINTSKASLSSR
jgi:acyl carrier protein phosphodiesterase